VADGLTIFGTFYPGAGQGPWPAVMLLHMNGGQRSDWDAFARQLAGEGYAALAIDMRGHGDTGGQSDWELAAGDLQQVWAYLTSREDVDETRAAIAGASIGANMSLVTGVEEPSVKTVIMLSPGLNYFDVTTDDRIVQYGNRPSLIVASEEDTLSADSSEELHELAMGENELVLYQGAGHGTNMFARKPELADLMIAWFDRHVKGEEPTADLPAPALFVVAWDDRSAFRQGLISSEAAVLDELPGASIYHLDLAISPDLLSVASLQEVRYTNQEDVTLDEVYFHLYPNLLGGNLAVSELTVNGEPVTPEYLDRAWTVMRVPLPAPLAPGEQAVIGMEFLVDVPTEGGNNYGVFAAIDDVLALAHFYPQIAVYDDEGWNIQAPPPNADVTYADSAFYLVRVTAPAEQVMVTSGNEIDRQLAGDEQIVTIAAGPVRDFYIASSDRYTVISDTVGETTVNSYGFPEFAEQNELVLEVATTALESLGARLGDYPFVEFDVAPTPNLALGVEYPGAVVVRSALYDPEATLGQTPALVFTEATVAHEVGHQWFYSVVGNDQIDEPWLDEALTQYVTFLYFLDAYGLEGGDGYRDTFVGRWDRVDRADIPIGLPAGEYDETEYGAIVYGRGPLFFEALSEEMGQETFEAFLRDYYRQNKWGISTGQTLKALAEAHCDCDLSPIFAEWVGDQ
jgi:dienelactone hydrolase